jgi:hypothetical protein
VRVPIDIPPNERSATLSDAPSHSGSLERFSNIFLFSFLFGFFINLMTLAALKAEARIFL